MSIKIGINGFGRIGRNVLRTLLENYPDNKVLAINDISSEKTISHLFNYDSTRGPSKFKMSFNQNNLKVKDQKIKYFKSKNAEILWKDFDIDVVIDATGKCTERKQAENHINLGAKKVIISAPVDYADFMCILGVNEKSYLNKNHNIISNASCTSNCFGIILNILEENFGIENAFMTSIHPYTKSQSLLDSPNQDLRKARTANSSIIPSKTEAIKAVEKIMPKMKNKINGLTVRVPTECVALLDITFKLKSKTSTTEINNIISNLSNEKLKKLIHYSTEPLVSCDFKNYTESAIIDSLSTMMIEEDNKSFKILAWYDNEWAYSCRLIELSEYIINN